MQTGFLVRSTASLTDRWTTVHWIAAALKAGHRAWILENRDVAVADRRWTARAFVLDGPLSAGEVAHRLTRRTAPRRRIALDRLDVLLLRHTPLDTTVLALGLALQQAGVTLVNPPAGQLLVAHKSWLAAQDLPTPETLVTGSLGDAMVFHQRVGALVVKPDRGSGGSGVQTVDAGDLRGLEAAFHAARGPLGRAVLQERLRGTEGERRLLWCDGEILGGYVRQAGPGDFRHNLRQGATPHPHTVDDDDRAFGPLLAPLLAPLGIRFAGLDVLHGRLLEVNAVNPGGTVYADALNGTRLGRAVVERLLAAPRHPRLP
jgi:glutathione synthase/RimK-type ligase-like ATP-grasp enzyme